jgi:hypothetical protein
LRSHPGTIVACADLAGRQSDPSHRFGNNIEVMLAPARISAMRSTSNANMAIVT